MHNNLMLVAGICRKSPGKKLEESIELQKKHIIDWCDRKFGSGNYSIHWFVDKGISGDDPNRPALLDLFSKIQEYDHAVAYRVDRYIRDPMGIVWFKKYFYTKGKPHKGCKLNFVYDVSDLYDDKGYLVLGQYLAFSVLCTLADVELIGIRKRQLDGIEDKRERLTEEEWRRLYPGRKKGSKNKKRRKN